MKNLDFVSLLISNTNKTERIRTFDGKWHTGVRRCPEVITERIGSIVHILSDCIEQLCGNDEHLLIYNFQLTGVPDWEGGVLCSLFMVVKPLSQIEDIGNLVGRPLQVVVRDNGEVMNDTRALILLDCMDEEELRESGDEAVLYGNFFDFDPLVTFVALYRDQPYDSLRALFHGLYDREVHIQEHSVAFDTLPQATAFLEEPDRINKPMRCIVEMQGHKGQLSEIRKKGFGRRIVKLIQLPSGDVIENYETIAFENEQQQDADSIQEAMDNKNDGED